MAARGGATTPSGPSASASLTPVSKLKMDELFLTWLSLDETQALVMALVDDAKHGRALRDVAQTAGGGSPCSPRSPRSPRGALGSPPLSPSKPRSPGQARSPRLRDSDGAHRGGITPTSTVAGGKGPDARIPRFYFPSGKPPPEEAVRSARRRVDELFAAAPGGLLLGDAALDALCSEVLELPSYFAAPLCTRLGASTSGTVTRDAFLAFWSASLLPHGADDAARAFEVLRPSPDPGAANGDGGTLAMRPQAALGPSDLDALVRRVVDSHPGLVFLQDTPEFQDRYRETVVMRLFHAANCPCALHAALAGSGGAEGAGGGGRGAGIGVGGGDGAKARRAGMPLGGARRGMRLQDFRRTDLVRVLRCLEVEEDINAHITGAPAQFFSYEHFYVLYCKFWELDLDHDFIIDREDLLRYGSHALTCRIVDRIFAFYGRPADDKDKTSAKEGGGGDPAAAAVSMGYEAFVWFLLSEEDKTQDASISYWFACADLDGNGVLVSHELEHFYAEQFHRLQCLSQDPVPFEDVLTQLTDMLRPEVAGCFTQKDFRRQPRFASSFFDVLFNLNKFVQFETKDPFASRQERLEAHLSDWDRFARTEYARLSLEEEDAEAEAEAAAEDGFGALAVA